MEQRDSIKSVISEVLTCGLFTFYSNSILFLGFLLTSLKSLTPMMACRRSGMNGQILHTCQHFAIDCSLMQKVLHIPLLRTYLKYKHYYHILYFLLFEIYKTCFKIYLQIMNIVFCIVHIAHFFRAVTFVFLI